MTMIPKILKRTVLFTVPMTMIVMDLVKTVPLMSLTRITPPMDPATPTMIPTNLIKAALPTDHAMKMILTDLIRTVLYMALITRTLFMGLAITTSMDLETTAIPTVLITGIVWLMVLATTINIKLSLLLFLCTFQWPCSEF
jgi:hypothetical protein